jgi:hypothetical protein
MRSAHIATHKVGVAWRMGAGVYFYRITVQPATGGAPFNSIRRLILLR